MERQKHTQTVVIAVLAVAILMMTIGFAATAYTQTLNIGGTDNTTVKAAKWSVHFDTEKIPSLSSWNWQHDYFRAYGTLTAKE